MSEALSGKTIVLGVCGSIAAYKAADLCSRLSKLGANVQVVMTEGAQEFIGALTFQTLTGNRVFSDIFNPENELHCSHIELADSADLLLVAPATANTLAGFANGLAADLLGSIYLATPAPVLLAPAMNGKMLAHPATVENLERLQRRGHHFVEPAEGMLACGYEGKGRLAEVEDIVEAVLKLLS